MALIPIMARVIGGGAHEVTLWCAVKFALPYVIAGWLLWWAAMRDYHC